MESRSSAQARSATEPDQPASRPNNEHIDKQTIATFRIMTCEPTSCDCRDPFILVSLVSASPSFRIASDVVRISLLSHLILQIPFRRFFYRGYEVHKLLDLTHAELMKLMHARARRHFARGSTSKAGAKLLKRLRKAKKEAPENEKPETIKTHMRNQIILPEMVASVVGVYNGLNFTQVNRR